MTKFWWVGQNKLDRDLNIWKQVAIINNEWKHNSLIYTRRCFLSRQCKKWTYINCNLISTRVRFANVGNATRTFTQRFEFCGAPNMNSENGFCCRKIKFWRSNLWLTGDFHTQEYTKDNNSVINICLIWTEFGAGWKFLAKRTEYKILSNLIHSLYVPIRNAKTGVNLTV
jgi:hypothetical protein